MVKSPKHVGIYVRVSSRSQDLASQLPDLERWAKAQDCEVAWYKDKVTGKTMDRPGWANLEADYRAGKVDTIVVWRIDRLGRTARGLTALFEELIARKVNLVSIRDALDLATPAGRLMAHVLASVAQYETEVRSERQRAGIDAALAAGKHMGRPKLAEGERGTRVKVTPEQAAQVKRLASEGTPKAAIARATGLSRPTIYSILAEADDATMPAEAAAEEARRDAAFAKTGEAIVVDDNPFGTTWVVSTRAAGKVERLRLAKGTREAILAWASREYPGLPISVRKYD